MPAKTKKIITLAFESDDLLEMRKILFKKGLSVQEFFAHFMHRCIMHDDMVEGFYDGALATKNEIMERGEDLKEVKLGDMDAMYDAIEKRIKEQ